MQPFEMGNQLRLTGPTAKVETEPLIGAFGRRAPDPQADQQTGDQGHIDLPPHAIGCLTQQVSAAQHPCDPPEKQLHGPPIPLRPGDECGVEVQPIRHPHQHLGRPIGVRLARRDMHEAERLRPQPGMRRRAQPPEHHIPLDPGSPRRR
jgi:hypothetical protein